MTYSCNWIMLLLLCTSAALVLCCDRFNRGSRQVLKAWSSRHGNGGLWHHTSLANSGGKRSRGGGWAETLMDRWNCNSNKGQADVILLRVQNQNEWKRHKYLAGMWPFRKFSDFKKFYHFQEIVPCTKEYLEKYTFLECSSISGKFDHAESHLWL